MYKEKIINGLTGEETWRDYTKEEIAQVEKSQIEGQKFIAAVMDLESKRQSAISKLAALGLTEDEIAAL